MGVSLLPIVVLVECDPLVRYGYSILIGDWGYEVLACASTAEAAESAAGRQISALVLGHDHAMMTDGLALAAGLARSLGAVPVAIIAGRLQRAVLDCAARYDFAILSETEEPDRLQLWLSGNLTQPAEIRR
jgi:CheY-like chemotaxis protein